MILKKVNLSRMTKRLAITIASQSRIQSMMPIFNQNCSNGHMARNISAFSFSTTNGSKPQMFQTKITFQIQKATTAQQLHQIISTHFKSFNFIHRTVLLQKATQRPFDQDDQLVEIVVEQIKYNWSHDYPLPTQNNSRAIANTICYMSRKKKLHDLDQQFSQIDYFQLAQHLNPKQFVMTLNGLLKLELLQKVIAKNPQFSLQKFITSNINQNFTPSLLVSMWFNILKFQKSSQNINNFFADLLKNKHFKNNLIDYMQIVYCYVNSEGKRDVDLTYPVMTPPKQLKEKGYVGAHELSVLYEQLAKLKKIKEVYFPDEFNELLEGCYLKILNQKDVPLRNIANVFNYLIQYESPTSNTLQATFHKYFTVLKYEVTLLERHQPNRKFRPNVDALSFVNLFNQLLQSYQTQNSYLNDLTSISLTYVQKILNFNFLSEYNERTFVRLLYAFQIAKKMIEERQPGRRLQLNSYTKSGLEKQIMKRSFNQVNNLGKIIGFVYNFDIRSKPICSKIKHMIESIPKQNQVFINYQQRLKQNCILHKNCKNCVNCFSK